MLQFINFFFIIIWVFRLLHYYKEANLFINIKLFKYFYLDNIDIYKIIKTSFKFFAKILVF